MTAGERRIISATKPSTETVGTSGSVVTYATASDRIANGGKSHRSDRKEAKGDTLETSTAKPFVLGSQAPYGATAAPLSLTASTAVRAMRSSQFTKRQLTSTNRQSREGQLRLNLSANTVGADIGQIGPGTRCGIGQWQAQQGIASTTYLTAVQHQMLVANTQVAFTACMASNPTTLSPPTWRVPSGKASKTRSKQRVVKKRNTVDPQVGAFLGEAQQLSC